MRYVRPLSALLGLIGLQCAAALQAEESDYRSIPGGTLISVLAAPDGSAVRQKIKALRMRRSLVSVADFEAFVQSHPYWQKGHGAQLLQGPGYLRSWLSPDKASSGLKHQQMMLNPVTEVSWYAARAYCQSEGGRLPEWFEWEYVAASDARNADARHQPGYGQRQIDALATASNTSEADVYGVRQMHGALWEWVEDYQALFAPSADPRDPGTGSQLGTCGGAALAFRDRTDFTMMMRIAALSSLLPDQSSAAVSFRCVRDE